MFNNENWGLTPQGYNRPTYDVILNAVETKMRELFGVKAILTIRSPLGILARLCAWLLDIAFKLGEDVYNSGFVDTAVGHALFSIGGVIGLKKLSAQKSRGHITVEGVANTIVPNGFLVGTVAGLYYTVQEGGRLDNQGKGKFSIMATEYGSDHNVLKYTITEIINPKIGIEKIYNEAATAGGQEQETPEEFRDRYNLSVDFAGGVNTDAIRAEILQKVDGVAACIVFENMTDFPDSKGLPPHSVEAIVYGGVEEDIAKAIFRRRAGGIETHGNIGIPVTSLSGQLLTIKFSRPEPVPVYIKIEDLKINKTFDIIDGIDAIKKALIAYIGEDETDSVSILNIGEDLIYNRLPCRVLSVEGVVDFNLTISKDNVNFDKNNIKMTAVQKAVTKYEWINISDPTIIDDGVVIGVG